MRFAACASVLGLYAASALAQSQPGCRNVMPEFTRAFAATAGSQTPPHGLKIELADVSPVRRDGANRNVIERAIRALGARVFPGRRLASGRSAGSGRAAFDSWRRGPSLRFVTAKPLPPCVAK